MTQRYERPRRALCPTLLRVAVALTLAATSGFAAAQQAALARAIDHIQAFPGRTLHGEGHSYTLRDVVKDADGAEHVRVARRFHGLRVVGGDMVLHSNRAGALVDVSRTLDQPIALDIAASRVTRAQAEAAALAHRAGTVQGRPELVVYARGERPQLAWDVLVTGEQPDGTDSELHVIVDAVGGAGVLDAWDDVMTAPATGTGHSFFSGTVSITTESSGGSFSMLDNTRGGSKTVDMKSRGFGQGTLYTDADNVWGNGATSNGQTVAVDAHYGGAVTWDYYLVVHGRNGIANDGRGATSRVHYKRNWANASWSDSCFCMNYGDGNSQLNPVVSLDVAGHEMSHGVTSRSAGLIYSGESGGLNEGTSDIFGTMVEFHANNANDPADWLIGEEVFKNGTFLRSMVKPSDDGASADCWYAGVGNLDVHYSSGVANHFYYLLSQGTTAGNPSPTCAPGNTRVATGTGTVAGIGRTKAEKIWYRALTVYMTSNTNYAGARAATLSAAADLYGAGSPEVNAVAAAWTAVNRP
jgi:zinc metalloprotease ZmpA